MGLITIETKHFAQGSNPPKDKENDVLRAYSMLFCPYAERLRLILLVKKLRHEIINIDLKRKPDWYLELNPQGKVPALDIDGKILVESLDICYYLDEVYPEPKLFSDDTAAKNKDKDLIKKFDSVIATYYQGIRDTETPISKHAEKLVSALEEYENELGVRGDYFGGSQPGMVDYMVWPWAERAELIDIAHGEKLPIPEGKLTRIRTWCKRMKQLDVVKDTIISIDRHDKLFKLYQSGGPVDYDSV